MDRLTQGILCKIAATLFFTIMSAFVRQITQEIPVAEAVFFRCFIALIPLFLWAWWRGTFSLLMQTEHKGRHFTRSINSFFGMFLGFLGLYFLPLADAVAISYAAPLLTVPLAVLLLKEKVRIYRWGATFLGFIGILIILFPLLGKGGSSSTGAVIMLTAAFSYALGFVIVRRLGTTESMEAIVFYFCVFNSLFSFIAMIYWGFQMPTLKQWGLLFIIGMTGGVGQMLMSQSSRIAEASLIAPFEYVSIIWATLIGFLAFGDLPTIYTYIGSALVILAGLIVLYRERKLGLERARD